jgi:hypothetical protein
MPRPLAQRLMEPARASKTCIALARKAREVADAVEEISATFERADVLAVTALCSHPPKRDPMLGSRRAGASFASRLVSCAWRLAVLLGLQTSGTAREPGSHSSRAVHESVWWNGELQLDWLVRRSVPTLCEAPVFREDNHHQATHLPALAVALRNDHIRLPILCETGVTRAHVSTRGDSSSGRL